MCWSLFFNKNAGLRPATLLRRNSSTGVFLWILQNFKNTFSHRTPLLAASVTAKSKRKPLNLYQIRKYFIINICYSWGKKRIAVLTAEHNHRKKLKIPIPLTHSQFKVFLYMKSNKKLHKYLKIVTTETIRLYLLQIYKVPKQNSTRSFWKLTIPGNFNLCFFVCVIMWISKPTIMNIRHESMREILAEIHDVYGCCLRNIVDKI